MSNFNAEDIANYRESQKAEAFQVEEIEAISFDDDGKETGTWNGYAVTRISDPADYCFECKDKHNADKLCDYLNSINFIDEPVLDDLTEWSQCITSLTMKEKKFDKIKQEIFDKEQSIIKETDFKEIYGANNKDVRKEHLDKIMVKDYAERDNLDYDISYLKRRISFLKQLVRTKTTLLEVKE